MQHELDVRFKAVESYVEKTKARRSDDELTAYLCRFGAVLICGNIERSIEIIILSRLQPRAQDRVLNFVKSHFKRGQNLDCDAIGQLLVRFDAGWYRRFSDFVTNSAEVKEGVASCYAIRNSAAHGGSQGVGVARLTELLAVHKKLLDAVVAATA